MEIVGYIVLVIGLVLAAKFVGDTRDKYGACCGKGCRGCKTYENRRKEEAK